MQHTIKFLLSITIIITALKAQSQAPAIEWQKNYGGSNYDNAFSIKQTKDGGYIFAGSTASNDSDVTTQKGNGDVWVVKLNSKGKIQWQKTYGGSRGEYSDDIILTQDGGYIFVGFTNSNDGDVVGYHQKPNSTETDCWIVKIDSIGNIQWTKTLGGSYSEYANSIIQTLDKGYIMAGFTMSNDFDVTGNHTLSMSITSDCWIVKLDSLGNVQWKKCYGGTDEDRAEGIAQNKDSGYVFCGGTISTNGDVVGKLNQSADVWLVKIDKIGNIQWQKTLGGDDAEGGGKMILNPDGTIVFGTTTNSTNGDITYNNGFNDFWIVKTDSVGNIIWQKTYGGSDYDDMFDFKAINDGGYLCTGQTNSTDKDVTGNHLGSSDFWVVKLDSDGNKQWQKCLGGSLDDYCSSIIPTQDSGYACLGYTISNDGDVSTNYGKSDIWLIKLKKDSLLPLRNIQLNSILSMGNNAAIVKNKWFVNNDDNVIAYNIERSEDGIYFYTINTIKADNKLYYIYTDDKLPTNSQSLFYRIVANTKNGTKMYSNIQSIIIHHSSLNNAIIYPNPTSGFINIRGKNIIAISITNVLGQLVFSQSFNVNSSVTKTINLLPFAKGYYNLHLHFNNATTETKKIVIQ